jgi:hypothetical protein
MFVSRTWSSSCGRSRKDSQATANNEHTENKQKRQLCFRKQRIASSRADEKDSTPETLVRTRCSPRKALESSTGTMHYFVGFGRKSRCQLSLCLPAFLARCTAQPCLVRVRLQPDPTSSWVYFYLNKARFVTSIFIDGEENGWLISR